MAGETLRDRDRVRLSKVADARKVLRTVEETRLATMSPMRSISASPTLRVIGLLLDVVEDMVREKAGL